MTLISSLHCFLLSLLTGYLHRYFEAYPFSLSLTRPSPEQAPAARCGELSGADVTTWLWDASYLLTRPSQELAEQLRLVVEPTIASKLSGDYRTGKRINMKKVIPYIASHYRKVKNLVEEDKTEQTWLPGPL